MLTDITFKTLYSSGDKESPISFFTDALSNSVSFDLGLGFFSSASINVLSLGFAKFISKGGKMRLYINQFISDEDYDAFTKTPDFVEEKVISDFHAMLNLLTIRDKHFFNCISYLIYTQRIDVKIIIPKTGGIAHQKFGIFTDEVGNKVSFIGSLNLTASALLSKNLESISCTLSWNTSIESMNDYQNLFDTYFNGEKDNTIVLSANKLTKEITKAFPTPEVQSLLNKEKELVDDLKFNKPMESHNISEIQEHRPHFPYQTGPFDYQIEAYNNWLSKGCSGIFAMATGTGKTITSLNCVLEEYKKTHGYKVLILVPSNDLVSQWSEEVNKFSFENLYIVNSHTNWKYELSQLKSDRMWGISSNYVIISTYDSFVIPTFQNILSKLIDDDMILIADEAHNVGRESVKSAFNFLTIKKRIALSATPNRQYDEEGTTSIEGFFHDTPPYCYSFSMERAIKENRLMHYLYYPRVAQLDDTEMKRYINYTKQLIIHFDPHTKCFDDSQIVKDLLMKRKRVIHKAKNKYQIFMSIVDEIIAKDKAHFCFVYTPEGVDYDSEKNERVLEKMRDMVYEKYPRIRTNTFLGGDEGKKEKLRAFAEGKIDMLFAMKCLDEGVDVPRAEVGIFTSSTGNPRQFIQRRGRLLRKHKDKTFAYIYDIIVVPNHIDIDKATFDMERSLVMNEIMRVAYFASLSDNYYEVIGTLSSILEHYQIEVSSLIAELQMQ